MKLPRISLGALMAIMVVIALDCVVVRSVLTRPYDAGLNIFLYGTLPMANLLSVGVARLVGGQVRSRRFLVGFEIAGLCALLATIWKIELSLILVADVLVRLGLMRWLDGSPIRQLIAAFVIVGVVPFLFQVLSGLLGGWLVGKFGRRAGPVPESEASPGRLPVRALLTLFVLVSIPAIIVEGILRSEVDASITRLAEGSEATVDFARSWKVPSALPPGSPIAKLDHAKVRVEEDRSPNQVELLSANEDVFVRDHRRVQVKVLDGSRAGESAGVPHYMLRPSP